MLRVIAGTARGRKLVAPKGARPTTDRLKEALFSSLGPSRVQGATVLDLYAGSGALAIEALSRGAARAVLVDRDRASEAAVGANLRTTGFDDVARFQRSSVSSFVATFVGVPVGGSPVAEAPFDLVFLDPPYDTPSAEITGVLAALDQRRLLEPGATVVLERAKAGELPSVPEHWEIERERAYGDTLLVVAHAG